MKIVIFSDSHGNVSNMIEVVKKEKPQQLIHLGDHIRDARRLKEEFPEIPVAMVPGNCDYSDESLEKTFSIQGIRFLITHGHRYNVKSSLLRLEMAAREKNCDIALFGHTHVPGIEENTKPFLMNPGSAGASRFGNNTYGLIEINEIGVLKMQIKDIEK